MQKLKRFGAFFGIFLILLTAMVYFFQERLIFLPTKLAQDYTYSFQADFDEIFLKTDDGANLNALHFHATDPKGVILYFHGNAGDLSRWGEIVLPFVELGYDVLVMDYRSYGKSTGKISEEALYQDAQLFYNYLNDTYKANDIIVYGRSLGASIATQLASKNQCQKLILETPFYSLLDAAKDRFSFLPLKQLLQYEMPSHKFIQGVESPIRIFHGTDDTVVSYASGKKLFDAIPNTDKKIYTIPNGSHNNLSDFEAYWNGIKMELE
ncbi:alpha/beta hydrolase [Muricauda sp. CAU 1633]|uniref:alpha/beta hydrolase n=1 Tax=Allomuricauda sp. CAU 1633 TaxID=2816036 RepID=UPI001A901E50|nr:alpha/beta fold hydrolase [Muricauda sp. CAU 1633]MBO0323267.1 alpha/beta hydrolase [Muricauda sp. CAU 1633]